MNRVAAVAAAFALALVPRSPGANAELGMQAPPLEIAAWIQGSPVDPSSGAQTNIFVIEFWATWCAPCRTSIPHLSRLQNRFRDRGVVVVGVSTESADEIRPFVEQMGERMSYTVAADNRDRTRKAYMEAFGVQGIPHAFVVDRNGRIAWHGHPMAGLEEVVEDVIEGRHDIDAARSAQQAVRMMEEYFGRLIDAAALGEAFVQDPGATPSLLNEFAWIILTHPRIHTRDVGLATRAARLAHERSGGRDASIMDTYARALFDSGRVEEAIEMQRKAIDAASDSETRAQLEATLQAYTARLN